MHITFFHRKPIPNFHFSVEIIFKDVRAHLPEDASYDIVESKFYSRGILPRLYNLFEVFQKRGKINHVTGDISYIALALSKRNTIHTILDCIFLQDSTGIKHSILKLLWLKIPVRRSRFVTTISEASKKEIVEFSGCDPEKVKVIPIALSPVFKKVSRGYNWENPTIMMIGTAPNKNTYRMIEALQGICCNVLMIGKPDDGIKLALEKSGLLFKYESGLNIEQMYLRYQKAEILFFASTYEGFGMPVIEAQSVGTMVLTSTISSMPEVAGYGTAMLVDPYDVQSIRSGLERILTDVDFREKCITSGYENVKRFDPVVVSKMYFDLYKQI